MKRTQRTKRMGLGIVIGLATLTICGHLISEAKSSYGPIVPPERPVVQPIVRPVQPAVFSANGSGGVTLAGRLDRASVLEGQGGLVRMELTIAAAERATGVEHRVPTDLVVVLDRSGSMQGHKLTFAKAAIRQLIDELGGDDRFALVTYAAGAHLAIPLADARDDGALNRQVASITANGGTNMSSGLDLANRTVAGSRASGRTARVILISDGLANQGDPSPEGLRRRAGQAVRGEFAVSTVGVGDDFNESLMSSIADAGTGNYYYLQDTRSLATVFSDEFAATRTQVASGVQVTLEPDPGVTVVSAGGYPLEQTDGRTSFRPGTLFGGQQRSVWVTYRVPHQTVGEHSLGGISLTWTDGDQRRRITLDERPVVACVRDMDRFREELDREVWAAGVVRESYNELQEKVAGLVKSGQKDDALRAIEAFDAETSAYNDWVQSPTVSRQLDEVKKLETEVNDAFTGVDQKLKQNRVGKGRHAVGRDLRRGGSKYSSN